MITLRSIRTAAAGALGAGALSGAMLFGTIPAAEAAPAPAPVTNFVASGAQGGVPDAPAITPPERGGYGGGGHGGFGGGHGGFGRGGGWGGHGGWGRGGGFGRGWGGGWGHGGWGRGGFFRHQWWNWWW